MNTVLTNKQDQQFTRNVALIRSEGFRDVGRVPAEIRKELMAGVKAGHLGRLRKEGLKPEIFFHPDYKEQAINYRIERVLASSEALKKILC